MQRRSGGPVEFEVEFESKCLREKSSARALAARAGQAADGRDDSRGDAPGGLGDRREHVSLLSA
jgi:hypothetical protein